MDVIDPHTHVGVNGKRDGGKIVNLDNERIGDVIRYSGRCWDLLFVVIVVVEAVFALP